MLQMIIHLIAHIIDNFLRDPAVYVLLKHAYYLCGG